MDTSTSATPTARVRPTAPGSRRAIRARQTVLGLSAAAVLVLTACTGGGDPDPSDTPTASVSSSASESASPTPSVSESASASATPSASESPSESVEPSQSTEPSESATAEPSESASEPGAGGETYVSEGGVFSWTLPTGWSAVSSDYSEESMDYAGYPYETLKFSSETNPIEAGATLGVGPTDGDGPKPGIVELLDSEELPELRRGMNTDSVWYRAYMVEPSSDMPGLTPDDEIAIMIQLVSVPEGVDPLAEDEDVWSAWNYSVQDPEMEGVVAANFISSSVSLSQAEELTGQSGEAALRAMIETDEYQQVRDLLNSMEVDRD